MNPGDEKEKLFGCPQVHHKRAQVRAQRLSTLYLSAPSCSKFPRSSFQEKITISNRTNIKLVKKIKKELRNNNT